MAVTDFIAAIELGSTNITGIAGKKNADGSIQILAYANAPSSDCIKKGAIFNLDKTTQILVSVIQKTGKRFAGFHQESLRRNWWTVHQKHAQPRHQTIRRRHQNLTGAD